MGKCDSVITEVRFIIEEEVTQCYIFIKALGDCPIGVQGCHHKTFPASKSALDILKSIRDGKDDYLLWGLEAPKR